MSMISNYKKKDKRTQVLDLFLATYQISCVYYAPLTAGFASIHQICTEASLHSFMYQLHPLHV